MLADRPVLKDMHVHEVCYINHTSIYFGHEVLMLRLDTPIYSESLGDPNIEILIQRTGEGTTADDFILDFTAVSNKVSFYKDSDIILEKALAEKQHYLVFELVIIEPKESEILEDDLALKKIVLENCVLDQNFEDAEKLRKEIEALEKKIINLQKVNK